MTSAVIEKKLNNSEANPKLTLEEFMRLPDIDASYELVEGEAIKKMSPKFFHSRLTASFWSELSSWANSYGQVEIEWSVVLKRKG